MQRHVAAWAVRFVKPWMMPRLMKTAFAGRHVNVFAVDAPSCRSSQTIDDFVPTLVIVTHRHAGIRVQRHLEHVETAPVPSLLCKNLSCRVVMLINSDMPLPLFSCYQRGLRAREHDDTSLPLGSPVQFQTAVRA